MFFPCVPSNEFKYYLPNSCNHLQLTPKVTLTHNNNMETSLLVTKFLRCMIFKLVRWYTEKKKSVTFTEVIS